MKRYTMKPTLFAALVLLALAGCRGSESENPPIHPNLNMDFQERFDPQEPNTMFADGRAMRPPVVGTVARGLLGENTDLYVGRGADGAYVQQIPVDVTMDFLRRGQERYNIYCSVCHGPAGDGLGIIMTGNYGYVPAPSYHDARLKEVEDGYLYDVIVNGVRTMPSYAQQISVADRWAIVAYIRALQRSQGATQGDVPAQILPTLQPPATAPADTAQAAPSPPGPSAEGVEQPSGL
jgi:mono/diheme cytochrome c family protein